MFGYTLGDVKIHYKDVKYLVVTCLVALYFTFRIDYNLKVKFGAFLLRIVFTLQFTLI
jgi:hypothetical protein